VFFLLFQRDVLDVKIKVRGNVAQQDVVVFVVVVFVVVVFVDVVLMRLMLLVFQLVF